MAVVSQERPRTGRAAELGLLVIALAIAIGAYVQVSLVLTGELPANLATRAGGLAALAVVAHVLVRWKATYADPVILPIAVALNGIGLTMIYRIDLAAGEAGEAGDADRQLMWTVVGVAAAMATLWLLKDHRILRRYTYTAMLAGLALIALPLVPFLGATINGARIWVFIGPMSFQPGELAKIVLGVFFAGYLVNERDTLALAGPKVLGLQLPRIRDLGPILLAWAASIVILVGERDLGTSLLFFGLFVAMLYVATERLSWVLIGLSLFAGGAVLASQFFGHVQARLDAWLTPFDPAVLDRDPGGSGQLVSGLFGLASGGLTGTGWGQGYPTTVPYANSDFIIAVIGEELGLVGLLAVLILYLILAERGMRAAIGVRDGFGKLFASGMAFVFAFQVFVVVGGITRVIPVTGLTAPFLALGGSSLVANWIIVALLLRISDSARRPAPPVTDGGEGGGGDDVPAPPRPSGNDNETEVVRL
ncbi:FtsW/RodA/SpoVE family cell cycle protein [Georgenia alba]|uniref:FtsW/RodA/SpoVE family cell cycle protein n=1 Tax=Georgenia alba TaxID=2233858 RepID=A0ABW2Q363_9MICO